MPGNMTRMQASTHEIAHGAPLLPARVEFGVGDPLDVLPEVPTHAQLAAFGLAMMGQEAQHGAVDVGTMHHHADHLYGRSVTIKAGTFLAGMPHKVGGLAVCVGDITVWTEQGRQRLVGAHVLTSNPGGMRVGYAHADTTWLTVHANLTGSTDVRTIEAALVDHPELLLTNRQELLQ